MQKNDQSSQEKLAVLRHSAAHLLAHAVQELFPGTKLTIGPATPEGFFYDFLPTANFKEEDLAATEARMHEIAKRNLPIAHEQMDKAAARTLYADNPFKLELIDGIPEGTVGIARQGDFHDLCRGGHVNSTGDIKHFKLLNVSGSYWRADKDNQPLQRISGTAFFTKEDLEQFEQRREHALRYDHRRLGKELELFSFHEEGTGFPFFHPNGQVVMNQLTRYARSILNKSGYDEIATPLMMTDELWKRSGHYDHYQDNMFFCPVEERQYAIRPMNCPGAMLIYGERPRSYRELPLRLAEFGLVHRYELSGVLHGLFRARSFTIDDAHIFCTPEQIGVEIEREIRMTQKLFQDFGFETVTIHLSTKPDNAMGSDELWNQAIAALKSGLDATDANYQIFAGDGAFYGPKIEFHVQDSMGRTWQCGTVQLDFFQAENFDLTYVDTDGTRKRPVIIHRAMYGSLERFFGILLEHHHGRLPFWLAPVQARVLKITDEQAPYAHDVAQKLKGAGIRVELDASSDPISGQIKAAQLKQIPWMLVVGKKEMANGTVTLRNLEGKQEFGLTIEQLIERAQELSPENL